MATARFPELWRELTGRELREHSRVPASLRLALTTRVVRMLRNGGTVEAWVRREHLGDGCDKQWEIAAWYEGPVPCLGQAAVLKALNDEAAAVCAQHAKDCPTDCPPIYSPQAAPGTYHCTQNEEWGGLLQANETWNCQCLAV